MITGPYSRPSTPSFLDQRQEAWFKYREDRDWDALQRRLAEITEAEQKAKDG